jgi:DNA-directed RNA polymerase specialized sigma24 family protein
VRDATDDERSAEPARTPEAAKPTPRREPCPELAAVSKKELRDALESATQLALAMTKSKARADDIAQTAFERLLTTRRWNPSRGPLVMHVLGIVRSLLNIAHRSKAPERDAKAHEGFHREVVGDHTGSPEDKALEQAEDTARSSKAASELDELQARVAHQAVPSGVLRCRTEGIDKAADIARKLKVPVEQVYRASELLRYHLKKIRAGERDHDEREKT